MLLRSGQYNKNHRNEKREKKENKINAEHFKTRVIIIHQKF